MLGKEGSMETHMLNMQGKSIREISRMMGISRNTVREYFVNAIQKCPLFSHSEMSPFSWVFAGRLRARLRSGPGGATDGRSPAFGSFSDFV